MDNSVSYYVSFNPLTVYENVMEESFVRKNVKGFPSKCTIIECN